MKQSTWREGSRRKEGRKVGLFPHHISRSPSFFHPSHRLVTFGCDHLSKPYRRSRPFEWTTFDLANSFPLSSLSSLRFFFSFFPLFPADGCRARVDDAWKSRFGRVSINRLRRRRLSRNRRLIYTRQFSYSLR